ncbi:MAG: hypothetical protein LLG06_08720 [Desulfobacteraceae bacterium]|nr:hypothetical protein [Desulfobacteraceae bacterium]
MFDRLHDEVTLRKKLPQVGDLVTNTKHGTLWKVIEKREVWAATGDDPDTGNPRLVPAIYLCYWKVEEGQMPGVGLMRGYTYTALDNTFEENWEITKKL